MKDQELFEKTIRKKLQRGYPEGELVNDLLKEGYSLDDIQKAIYNSSSGKTAQQGFSKGSNIPLWYLLSVGLVILGLALVSVKFIWLSKYGWVLLVIGLAGIAARFVIPILKEQIKK